MEQPEQQQQQSQPQVQPPKFPPGADDYYNVAMARQLLSDPGYLARLQTGSILNTPFTWWRCVLCGYPDPQPIAANPRICCAGCGQSTMRPIAECPTWDVHDTAYYPEESCGEPQEIPIGANTNTPYNNGYRDKPLHAYEQEAHARYQRDVIRMLVGGVIAVAVAWVAMWVASQAH